MPETAPISAGWLWQQQLRELLVLLKPVCVVLASFFLSRSWQDCVAVVRGKAL